MGRARRLHPGNLSPFSCLTSRVCQRRSMRVAQLALERDDTFPVVLRCTRAAPSSILGVQVMRQGALAEKACERDACSRRPHEVLAAPRTTNDQRARARRRRPAQVPPLVVARWQVPLSQHRRAVCALQVAFAVIVAPTMLDQRRCWISETAGSLSDAPLRRDGQSGGGLCRGIQGFRRRSRRGRGRL
jgi:hypothetical protein